MGVEWFIMRHLVLNRHLWRNSIGKVMCYLNSSLVEIASLQTEIELVSSAAFSLI